MENPDQPTDNIIDQGSRTPERVNHHQSPTANQAETQQNSAEINSEHKESHNHHGNSILKQSSPAYSNDATSPSFESHDYGPVSLEIADHNTVSELRYSSDTLKPQEACQHDHSGQKTSNETFQDYQQKKVGSQVELHPGEIRGSDLPEVIPTLWEAFVDSVAQYPSNLALASVHQKGEVGGHQNIALDHDAYKANPYLRWSYTDFAKAILRTVHAFEAESITQGCLVFTFCTNSAEFVTIVWAAMALGCTIVPIHSRALLNKEEVHHIIKNAKATAKIDRTIGFAQNAAIARQIVDLEIVSPEHIVVMEEDAADSSWRSFTNFLPAPVEDSALDLARYNESTKQWALIIYTSGTTALPKGVVLDSYRIDRIIAIRRQAAPFTPGDSCFLPLPNNHAFFHLFSLLAPGVGGGIVLPGPTFQPQHAPEIMEMEQCAHFPMSPTMVHAIKDIVASKGVKFNSLKTITTGGAKLSIEFVEACLQTIGAQGVEVIYGTTEGCVTVSTGVITSAQDIIRNGDAAVGVPRLGCTIKICQPGDTEPLPRNTEGDLHYSTATLCNGYANGDKPDTFYTDEQGRHWFATGDAATINDEGMVFIVGRLKDMIVRGGVNIAPASMEFVLAKDPATAPFNIQVVGKLDPIAGEVPVGISTKAVTLDDIEKIQNTVLEHMGPIYEPEEILTLEQLGLEDFPRTLLGKVQKYKLTATVRKYLDARDIPRIDPVEVDSTLR